MQAQAGARGGPLLLQAREEAKRIKRIKRIKKDQKDQKKDQKEGKDQKDQKDQKDPAVHGAERIKKDQPHPPSGAWRPMVDQWSHHPWPMAGEW